MQADIATKVVLTLEGEEIRILKALCQNPHPQYQTSPELMEFAKNLHSFLSTVVNKSQREDIEINDTLD